MNGEKTPNTDDVVPEEALAPAEEHPDFPQEETTTTIESGLMERVIEEPVLLNEREASKRFLAEERTRLAQEIRAERHGNRVRLAELRVRAGMLSSELDASRGDLEKENQEYEALMNSRSVEANTMAGRVRSLLGKVGIRFSSDEEMGRAIVEGAQRRDAIAGDAQTLEEEVETLNTLIDDDTLLVGIKARLIEHYAKAGGVAEQHLDSRMRSVEQTAIRNGVFFVHTIQEYAGLRHNQLSNVSASATREDDWDTLLALEPSVSTSTLIPGRSEDGGVSGLWSDTGGFLLGGGGIHYADRNDLASQSIGIKQRVVNGFERQSIEDIDRAVSKPRGERGTMISRQHGNEEIGTSYNEVIVDSPKVFGYFQPVGIEADERFADGKYWAGDVKTRYEHERLVSANEELAKLEKDPAQKTLFDRKLEDYENDLAVFNRKISEYRNHFQEIKARGIPLYVMTPDRRMLECLGVNDDGTVNVGRELRPEEVATGRAGLPPEKRREIGERLLRKTLFKDDRTQEEAREIITELPEAQPVIVTEQNFPGSTVVRIGNKGFALRKNARGDIEGNELGYMEDGRVGPVYQLHGADIEQLREKGILDLAFKDEELPERMAA